MKVGYAIFNRSRRFSTLIQRANTRLQSSIIDKADFAKIPDLFGIKFPRCMNPRGLLHTQITIDAMMINNSLISSL